MPKEGSDLAQHYMRLEGSIKSFPDLVTYEEVKALLQHGTAL